MAPCILPASTRSSQMCLLREKIIAVLPESILFQGSASVCSPFSLRLSPLCVSGCKIALSVLLNRSLMHLSVYLQFFRTYFQISFIFSSELCIFFPSNVYLFCSGGGYFSHCFKQTCRTTLAFALVPFSSFYIECHHLNVNFQSIPLGYLATLCLRSLEEVCVSKPGSKWRWQGNFLPPQQQQLRKKVDLFVCPFATARYLGTFELLKLKICNINLWYLISCHLS